MSKLVIPATKHKPEIILEVGVWYETFTTDGGWHSEASDWLFKIDDIRDNIAYVTTFTGIEKKIKNTRTQFTKNAVAAGYKIYYAISI